MEFPRILYAAAEPTGRIFESQQELDAAGPGWQETPIDPQAPAPQGEVPEPPPAEDEPPPRHSRR